MNKFHRVVSTLLVLVISLSVPVWGQKKRKSSEGEPDGIRMRKAEFYFTEGEKYFILEDYAKALLYYQSAIEINPENGTVHYKVAEVLSRSSKQDDQLRASLSIENALRLDKTNKYFYLLAASIYNSMAKFDKAAQAYENMIEEVPHTEDYLYELAAVYQYANRREDAIKAYNRAESALGINEISSVQKIKLLLEGNKTKEAIQEGEKLMAAFPDEERYVMALAEILSQKNMMDQAIGYLEKYATQHADAPNAKMLLAGLYRDTKQEQKARPLLSSLFDDNTVPIGSKLVILGAYNTELHQRPSRTAEPDKEAFVLELFEKLKKTNPQETNVHIIGGDIYLTLGRNREAQQEYMAAVASGEVNFEVWENLLYLELHADMFDQVIEHSEQALELFPNHAVIHYFNGVAQLRKRHNREAIFSLEQAKKLAVSNEALIADINSMLGDAYNSTKDFEKSDKAYDDALAFNATNENVLNNYSFFLAIRKANLEKAEKMSALLVKNNPDNPAYLDTHAWVLYMREKYKDARRVIEKAVSTGKASAAHFEHYGDILYKLGDVNGAVQQWERARGMNAHNEILNKKITNRKIYE